MKKKIIKVLANTKFEDIKRGDLVITGEIHRVVRIFNEKEKSFSVITVKPKCDYCSTHKHYGREIICKHGRVMSVGYEQHSFLKIIK